MALVGLTVGGTAAAQAAKPLPTEERLQVQGLQLAQERSCLRCHDPVRHYVGPSFRDIAERYRTDTTAGERLTDKIQHGSVGRWGRVIMPRQPQVSPAEAAVLAHWVLSH